MKRILNYTIVMISSMMMLTACTKCSQTPPAETPPVETTTPPAEPMPGDVSAAPAVEEPAPAK